MLVNGDQAFITCISLPKTGGSRKRGRHSATMPVGSAADDRLTH